MKTLINYHQQQKPEGKSTLFRQLLELQIELEKQMKLGHECDQELRVINASIDRLFERVVQGKTI